MEENQRHIDDALRERLGSYTETPPPAVWEEIARRLPEAPRRRVAFPWWGWMIALLLVSGAGIFMGKAFLNKEHNAEGANSTAQLQKPHREGAGISGGAIVANNIMDSLKKQSGKQEEDHSDKNSSAKISHSIAKDMHPLRRRKRGRKAASDDSAGQVARTRPSHSSQHRAGHKHVAKSAGPENSDTEKALSANKPAFSKAPASAAGDRGFNEKDTAESTANGYIAGHSDKGHPAANTHNFSTDKPDIPHQSVAKNKRRNITHKSTPHINTVSGGVAKSDKNRKATNADSLSVPANDHPANTIAASLQKKKALSKSSAHPATKYPSNSNNHLAANTKNKTLLRAGNPKKEPATLALSARPKSAPAKGDSALLKNVSERNNRIIKPSRNKEGAVANKGKRPASVPLKSTKAQRLAANKKQRCQHKIFCRKYSKYSD